DLESERIGIVAKLAQVADAGAPLLHGLNDLLFPDIFPQDDQDVFRLVLIGQVQVGPATLEVETLHRGIEVDQAHGNAGDADDRETDAIAFALDPAAFLDVQVKRIGKNIDRIEADFLGHANSIGRVLAGLSPGGVDESQLHGFSSFHKMMAAPSDCRWIVSPEQKDSCGKRLCSLRGEIRYP